MRLRCTTWQPRSRNGSAVGLGLVILALNIDMPNRGADLPKREAIARAVLRSIGALPPERRPQAESEALK